MIDLSSVDVEDLAGRLNLENGRLTSSGQEFNFSCFGPEHSHGDESPSAYINVDSTAWFCHGCKRSGNAITLVCETLQVARPEAESKLRDWYGIEFNEPAGGSMVAETEARFRPKPPEPERNTPPRSWVLGAQADWLADAGEPWAKYILERGFTPETLQDWDVGYDYLSDRVAIPVYGLDGELVGVKARGWHPEQQPKYLILGDKPNQLMYGFDPYESKEVVFGLHRNRDHRTVVICEGELNAMALAQMGVPRPVASGMSYFSERQTQLVIREAEEVVIFYDAGDAGWAGTWGRRASSGKYKPGLVQLLRDHVQVRVVDPPKSDPADLMQEGYAEEVLELIENAPSSLARQLQLH